jgi:hypothetical protein
LFSLLASKRCGVHVDVFVVTSSQMAQPYASTASEPHDKHSVWFTVPVRESLLGEHSESTINDTSGGVVSMVTWSPRNTVDTTSLDTLHRVSTS